MESSMNMNNLARSLPSRALVMAEQETVDRFKAAAQALTLLYRSSTQASKRHFDAGYAAALDDLLNIIQQGLSAGPDVNQSHEHVEEGMTIGRVMDWIEARQEGLRLAASGEDDEDENSALRAGSSRQKVPVLQESRSSERTSRTKQSAQSTSPPSSSATDEQDSSRVPKASQSPPPSPPFTTSTPTHTRQQTRCSKNRDRMSHAQPLQASTTANTMNTHTSTSLSNASVLGAKRRHAAMILDAYAPLPSAVTLPPPDMTDSSPTQDNAFHFTLGPAALPPSNMTPVGSRRRLRSLRSNNALRAEIPNASPVCEQPLGISHPSALVSIDSVMDFEDEGGRERKRVARR